MKHRKQARRTGLLLASVSLTVLVAACGTREPPPDLNAPPTEREEMLLGVDASDEYFLTRYRKCIRWKAEYTCRQEPYGDDGGAFE